MTAILRIKQLAFERNNEFLFNHVNSDLNQGELLEVRGNNGSGKSTLLRMIAGFIEPHLGYIHWKESCIFKNRDVFQEQVQYMGHQNGIKLHLTLHENLQLSGILIKRKPTLLMINQVLDQTGLGAHHHTKAYHLSVGQRRRLVLARLLLNPAPFWILDEPLSSLDSDGQQLLNALLNQHLSGHGMAVIATHQNCTVSHPVKTIYLGDQYVT